MDHHSTRSHDRTITLTAIDPLQDAPGADDDVEIPIGQLPTEVGVLIVRAGAQAGERFQLVDLVTRLGRHPDSEISLDDITVSRRHAEIERTHRWLRRLRCRVAQRHVREPGSHRPTA